jgi:hypothetical protein
LCENSKGIFYSNPFNEDDKSANEIILNLKCKVVFLDYSEFTEESDFNETKEYKQSVIYYYMDKELEPMI